MSTDTAKHTAQTQVSEIAGVFGESEQVQSAVQELQVNGIARRNISVLAGKEVLEATYGDELPSVQALLKDKDVPTDALISDEEVGIARGALMSGGMLIGAALFALPASVMFSETAASLAALAAVILGSALGLFASNRLLSRQQERLKMQDRSGGFIVWVAIPSKAKEIAATYVLRKNGAQAIQAAA